MIDPTSGFWPFVDALEPRFTLSELRRLADDLLPSLFSECENATAIVCPACGGHREVVQAISRGDGEIKFFVYCPHHLRVEAPLDSLKQWTLDFDLLAQTISKGMNLRGRCAVLLPGRLWRLGRVSWRGASRDALFARGLSWFDHPTLVSRIVRAVKPIVFVADRLPPSNIWPNRQPPTISLAEIATWTDGVLDCDVDAIVSMLTEVEFDASHATSQSIDPGELKTIVRRQIKAEQKTQLTDDIFIAAYQQEGSMRKAAEFLTAQTGQAVTKDRVQSAVTRAGGAAAVLRSSDSSSIVRTVASQRRDGKKKFIQKPNSQEN